MIKRASTAAVLPIEDDIKEDNDDAPRAQEPPLRNRVFSRVAAEENTRESTSGIASELHTAHRACPAGKSCSVDNPPDLLRLTSCGERPSSPMADYVSQRARGSELE